MNKAELRKITQYRISDSAMQDLDDGYELFGKYARCIYLSNAGDWDVWLCNPSDIAEGLSPRKLKAIRRAFPDELEYHELTGEGVFPHVPTEVLLEVFPILGIRRRKEPNKGAFQTCGNRPLRDDETRLNRGFTRADPNLPLPTGVDALLPGNPSIAGPLSHKIPNLEGI